MNLDKYTIPNLFIMKKQKDKPGAFNLGGNVFYITKVEGDEVRIAWSVNIDFPGGKDYMHHASTIGNGRYKKKYFEENFYFVSRLDNWKRQSMIRAIFHKQNEDVINEN